MQGTAFPAHIERNVLKTQAPYEVVLLQDLVIMDELYFDKAFSYDNLRKALNRCCRNVRWKDSVVGYELHAQSHTYKLRQDIMNGTYKISPYQKFVIHEPKTREIVATRIRDRQVQMALCMGGLYEDITEHFIYDNCACQKGKGVDFALKRMKIHMERFYRKNGENGYVLRMDIKKFFPSTSHDVAKEAMAKRISDHKVLDLVYMVIDSFEGDKGIGLGSQISQLVELAVLDDIDHFIKERLHVKQYVRYMDDFILIHKDKEYLKYCWSEIENMLKEIGLELNRKTSIQPLRQGFTFLRWKMRYSPSGKVIMRMDKTKLGKQRRRLKKLMLKESSGVIEHGSSENSLIAWIANARRGNTHYQVIRMKQYYFKKEKYYANYRRTLIENRA